ncbi:Putative RNA-dependent RNA polymerase, eukaryotic-type [Septoria linicola]|uniref:RNA-dependent RNA polymerase n=1 Tax=Septoria linicola TaxID=215465 RepID=A0A9Q9AKL6_9PEZI|nr:putative RNA-dependent RNA polymerase, eukaryotic-type [Septoria linicola]USW49674.1 Putative RNA-dependent RNA polymerase, eukaryotic-type [Septoria linicola]
MARKRKSSEVEALPPTAETAHGSEMEDKAATIVGQFKELCRAARLDLPTASSKSPDRGLQERSDKLWQAYRHLSWKNPQRLSEEVATFLCNVESGQASHGTRLGLLLDTLKTASDETATPRIDRFRNPVKSSNDLPTIPDQTQPCSTADYLNPPPSPSPLVSKMPGQANLKSSFKTKKAGADIAPSIKPVVQAFRPPTPPKANKAAERTKQQRLSFAAPPKPPVFIEPAAPAHRPVASNLKPNPNTSFASTGANTSFGQNNSFWSSQDTRKSSQTDATSFSDVPPPAHPRESTNYGSTLSSTEAEKWLEACRQFESSQKSSSTDKTIRPATSLSANSAESNSSDYTTAPTSPSKGIISGPRRAQDAVFQSSIQETDYGSSIGGSTLGDLDNYRFRPAGVFDHEMPDAPVLTTVHEGFTAAATHLGPNALNLPEDQPQLSTMQFEPTSSFARLALPSCFENLPFVIMWEAQRLLQNGNVSTSDLVARWKPRDLHTLYRLETSGQKGFEKGFASEGEIDLENITFGAGLQYSQSSAGPIFDLVLAAPKHDKSCDLQRRCGADRVLYVDVPSLSKPPQLHKGRDIMARFADMASKPQRFLGRRWILYVVQPNKQSKNSAISGSSRLIFFAIDDAPVWTLFDDIIPYHENAHQPARKLYTRLELSMSRTIAALQFHEDDIEFKAEDQFATRERDDDTFLDPDLRSLKAQVDSEHNFDPKKEMSDGCAVMSSWAYWQVHRALGMENIRSAFQARIGGAKGVWYKDREDFTGMDQQKPPGPHIKLARSQVKVNRSTLAGCNVHTLSFNVVKSNSYAKTSLMHTGFMPILLDRGVPKQVMLDVIRSQVRREMEQFEDAVKGGPHTLRRWMHAQNGMFEERNREREMLLRPDGLPLSRDERIVQLLEAGFDQCSLPYLAREVKLMAQQAFDLKKKNYKIKLDRSTTLMGIADPFGCLLPGEVHVNFSTPFLESTGMSWLRLNMDGLIARNPALAPWDIQKVKFVCKPELEHLPDLFIFSTRGRRPLASLLQGGDYDGDTFWGCWEPKFARFFKNAPCPVELPAPESFGIVKRKETLRHYVRNPQSDDEWCQWLGEMAVASLGMNLLGVVTKLHERLVYKTGDLKSRQAIQLVHLHDYLVDAGKQGYDFSFDALNEFKRSIDMPPSLPDPAYWEILKGDRNGTDYENEPDNYPVDKIAVVGNIIDEAYFNVVQPLMAESLQRVQEILAITGKRDPDLTKLYEQMLAASVDNPTIENALHELKSDLQKVRDYYGINYRKYDFDDLIAAVRLEYDQVLPHDTHDPTIVEWLRRCGSDLSMWDKLKASALAKFQHKGADNPGKFIFSIAGGELCQLKLSEMGSTRSMCMDQYRMLKLRKERKVKLRDDYASDHGDNLEDDELVGDTAYY